MDSGLGHLDGDKGVFVSAVHAIQRFGSDYGRIVSVRERKHRLYDRCIRVVPSTRAAQPMLTEEDFVRVGRLKNTLVRVNRASSGSVQLTSRGRVQDAEGVRFSQPLNGTELDAKELRHQEDSACFGWMCRASSSVARLPSALLLGKQIRDQCWNSIDAQPRVASECLGAIGQKGGRIPVHYVDAFGFKLALLLSFDDIEPVRGHRCTTPVRTVSWKHRPQGPMILTLLLLVEIWCTSGYRGVPRYFRESFRR